MEKVQSFSFLTLEIDKKKDQHKCSYISLWVAVAIFLLCFKVIYSKYSKHRPYTVAHTIVCVGSKMLNHSLNHEFSLFKLITCPESDQGCGGSQI